MSYSKRRRVTIACNRCRSQKLRCDGAQPGCGRCFARQAICEYPKKIERANVTVEYVRHLESSIENLKRRLSETEVTEKIGYDENLFSLIKTNDDTGQAAHNRCVSEPPVSFENYGVVDSRPKDIADFDQCISPTSPHSISSNQSGPDPVHTLTTSEDDLQRAEIVPQHTHHPSDSDNDASKQCMVCLVDLVSTANDSELEECIKIYRSKTASFDISIRAVPCQNRKGWDLPPQSVAEEYFENYLVYENTVCLFSHKQSFLAAYEQCIPACECDRIQCPPAPTTTTATAAAAAPPRKLSGSYDAVYEAAQEAQNQMWRSKDNAVSRKRTYDAVHEAAEETKIFDSSREKNCSVATPICETARAKRFYDLSYEEQQRALVELKIIYSVLNLIFALGCLHTPSSTSRGANLFYERAQQVQRMFSSDERSPSLLILQALLLEAQYLHLICEHKLGLNALIEAVRIAHKLNIPDASVNEASSQSAQEQELCRRLWFGCLNLDRKVSKSARIPFLISRNLILNNLMRPTSRHVGVEYPQGHELKQATNESLLEFYEQAFKLQCLIADVMKSFYSTPSHQGCGESLSGFLARILEFDEKLGRYKEELPSKFLVSVDKRASLSNPAVVLHIRYLYIRLLLGRAVLIQQNETDSLGAPKSMHHRHLATQISKTCLRAVQDLIFLLWNSGDYVTEPFPWRFCFYVYNAGTTIVAAMARNQASQLDVSQPFLEKTWEYTMKLLSSSHFPYQECNDRVESLKEAYERAQTELAGLDDVCELSMLPAMPEGIH